MDKVANSITSIHTLGEKLSSYLSEAQVNKVKHAYFYAEQAHEGQYRRSGEPYIIHPLAVATILSEMHMDHETLMAAMLHDVIEDTGISKTAIAKQFNETVADLVDGVSKLTQIAFRSKAEAQAENFQKMTLAMAQDIRVILIKLADRLHNMRTLGVLNPQKRRRIAKETLEIYSPIANRLGMNDMRIEFEDLFFSAVYPMRARRIKAAVKKVRGNRKHVLEDIQKALEDSLASAGIEAKVFGREKHLYGIYQKMRAKRKSFHDIMDFFAFRVIVNDAATCYQVLGNVHNLYKPVAGQFKDYIAIPKANGYQSLHTVLFGMHGIPMEIQIRTHEMEETANNGISAHWLYKSDSDDSPFSGSQNRAQQWISGLLEMQRQAGDSLEFIEHVKVDLFPEEIYVFTPEGDIFELPVNATPVDFAYAIHTDIGNTCTGCRINKRNASLSEPLQSGQTVEISTTEGSQPNIAWLDFVTSGKARSNIRHYLKNQELAESITMGERLLDKALSNLGSSLKKTKPYQIELLVSETRCSDFQGILEDIGLGNRIAHLVAQQLIANKKATLFSSNTDKKSSPETQAPLPIHGTEGIAVSYADCCYPIHGDPIVGELGTGKGITVHTTYCDNIAPHRHNHMKCTPLSWAEDMDREFIVELLVELGDQQGVIALLAARINSLNANIESIRIDEKNARHATAHILISVKNRVHLARIMRRIRTIKSVNRVTRIKNTKN